MFFIPKKFTILFLALLSFGTSVSQAASFDKGGFHVTLEPIVAYEFTAVNVPTPHTRGMLVYGGRVTAGSKRLSAEVEYTVGNSLESWKRGISLSATDHVDAILPILFPENIDRT